MTQPSVSILFPFRGDGGWRDTIFDKVVARYAAFYPSIQMCLGTNDDEPFCRAAARNDAFEQATGDILIVNDADTFCTWHSLDRALALVANGEPFCLPYNVYFNVNREWTTWFLEDNEPTANFPNEIPEEGYDHRLLTAESGVLVVSREAWENANGYDERFIGWGYEDNAFPRRLGQANGRGLRLRGSAYHLYHPVNGDPFDHPWIKHNRELFNSYPSHMWREEA